MAIEYCNITTDLKRVYNRIDEYQEKELVENWTAHTTYTTTVYEKRGTGYVGMVFQNGTQLTVTTTVALVHATASTFFYDGNVDILYVHPSSGTPSSYDMEIGEDWDAYKTACRNEAQEYVDGYLGSTYSTPLRPKSRATHTSNTYDAPIRDLTALLTCWKIVSRTDHEEGLKILKRAHNPVPEIGELPGILYELLDGKLALQDQITVKETGGYNIYPYASNTVTIWPMLTGRYTGSTYKMWRLQIDTAGALGTATWKVSYDGGTTWDQTLQATKDATEDEYRFYVADGLWVQWPSTTYVKDEYWDIELFPLSDTREIVSNIGTVRNVR